MSQDEVAATRRVAGQLADYGGDFPARQLDQPITFLTAGCGKTFFLEWKET
jgi:hypothetical protein